MKLTDLIKELSQPESYPVQAEDVTIVQTHISVVFLVGDRAYKIKKPVDLGFLDFTTLARRRHFCEEEVRLNRRGAPGVYLGVEPVVRAGKRLQIGGDGEVVEWAVVMKRLPEERTLRSLLERGAFSVDLAKGLGKRIAQFHATTECGAHLAEHGGFEAVAFNVRENFEQLEPFVGQSISEEVHSRLRELSEQGLADLEATMRKRAREGRICDTHGDLHLEHVYSLTEADSPTDLLMVDCIEFNERFRYADPVADIAFLAMDLRFRARTDLGQALTDAYFDATGDAEGRRLLDFYVAYRAVVRGKVESFALLGEEIPRAERQRALERARPYMLLALEALSQPAARPCLVASIGLPGAGKSLLAEGLEGEAGFVRVSTDETRKHLAGVPVGKEAEVRLDDSYYTSDWNDKTYEACFEAADGLLFKGARVVLDGTYREPDRRDRLADLARKWCVAGQVFVCEAEPSEIKRRLDSRPAGASDAGWEVYKKIAPTWKAIGAEFDLAASVVSTMGAPEAALDDAIAILRERRLA